MAVVRPWSSDALMREVAAVLASGDPIGSTADEIATALPWPMEGGDLQRDLEDLVARGFLDRFGVGRGALYALSPYADAVREDAGTLVHRAS